MTVLRPAGPTCIAPAVFMGAMAVDSVEGGKKTNPMGYSSLENEAFGVALAESLRDRGLLYTGSERAPFLIRAQILDIAHPAAGYTIDITAIIRYLVVSRADDRTVLDRVIDSSYGLGVRDEYFGNKRFRLVLEGVVRRSISGFLEALCAAQPGTGT